MDVLPQTSQCLFQRRCVQATLYKLKRQELSFLWGERRLLCSSLDWENMLCNVGQQDMSENHLPLPACLHVGVWVWIKRLYRNLGKFGPRTSRRHQCVHVSGWLGCFIAI